MSPSKHLRPNCYNHVWTWCFHRLHNSRQSVSCVLLSHLLIVRLSLSGELTTTTKASFLRTPNYLVLPVHRLYTGLCGTESLSERSNLPFRDNLCPTAIDGYAYLASIAEHQSYMIGDPSNSSKNLSTSYHSKPLYSPEPPAQISICPRCAKNRLYL